MTAVADPTVDELDAARDGVGVDAERACLGGALWSSTAITEIVEIVDPGDWSQPKHAAIAAAIAALADTGQVIEPTSVLAELERRGEMLRVGGAPYLHTLLAAGSPAYLHYARLVANRAHLRRIGQTGQRLQQLALVGDVDAPDEVLDRARADLDAVAERRRGRELYAFADLLNAAVDGYGDPIPPGLATPWPDLDEILGGGGLRAGALTIVGARPGVGKSVIAVNLARYAAAGGAGVLVASLEMPQAELMDRLVAAEGPVDYGRLRDHKLTEADWQAVDRAADALRHHPIRIDDNPNATLASIRAAGRDMTRTPTGLGLLVIDYLQLIKPADSRQPRQEQVAAVARGCKLLARELAVPVVALSGINRGPTARASARPTMADLRESGEIENSADQIILLHRDDEKHGEIELAVVKNRAGRTGSVSLSWAGHYQRAASLSRYA